MGCEALKSLCTRDLATYTWVLKSWVGSVGAFWKIFSSLSTYLRAKGSIIGGALAGAPRERGGSIIHLLGAQAPSRARS